jgi:hypothetical protein
MLAFVLFNSGVAMVQILRRPSLVDPTTGFGPVDAALSPARDRGRRLAEAAFHRAEAERASTWRAFARDLSILVEEAEALLRALERELELLAEEVEMVVEDFALQLDELMLRMSPSWTGRLRLAALRGLLHCRRPRRFPYRLLLTAGPAMICITFLSVRQPRQLVVLPPGVYIKL